MTDRELLQMALDALEAAYHPDTKAGGVMEAISTRLAQPNEFNPDWDSMAVMVEEQQRMAKRIEELESALAQPEQEPVAWGIANTRPTEKHPLMMVMLDKPEPSHLVVPLYTTPPQQPEQEPVAWMYQDKSTNEVKFQKHMRAFVDHGATYEVQLYTAPSQRESVYCGCGDEIVGGDGARCGTCVAVKYKAKEWVGLTIEERTDIRRRIQEYTPMDNIKYGEAVQFFTEEALKEKNT